MYGLKAARYSEAIQQYSKAIQKNPESATYFTNRALCYIQVISAPRV